MNENPYYSGIEEPAEPKQKTKSKLSVAAFVLSILSILLSCIMLSFPFALLSIIFALIAIIKKSGGRGLPVSSMIISFFSMGISTLLIILFMPLFSVLPELSNDIIELRSDENYQEIIEEYERTGKLPERFEKYTEGETGEFFDKYCGGFENFIDIYLHTEQ